MIFQVVDVRVPTTLYIVCPQANEASRNMRIQKNNSPSNWESQVIGILQLTAPKREGLFSYSLFAPNIFHSSKSHTKRDEERTMSVHIETPDGVILSEPFSIVVEYYETC